MRPNSPLCVLALIVAVLACLLAVDPQAWGADEPEPPPLSLLLYDTGATVGGHLPLAALGDDGLAMTVARRIEAYTRLATTVTRTEAPETLSPRAAPVLLLADPPAAGQSPGWLDGYIRGGGFVVISPESDEAAQAFRDWLQWAAPRTPVIEASQAALAREEDRLPERFRAALVDTGSVDAVRADGEVRVVAPRSVRPRAGAPVEEHRVRLAAAMSLAGALRSPYARRLAEDPIAIAARREGSVLLIDLTLADLEREEAPAVTVTDASGSVRRAAHAQGGAAAYVVDIAEPPFDPAAYWVNVRWPGSPRLSRVQRLSDVMGSVDTEILGQNVWAAGSPAGIRVIVRNGTTGEPIGGAAIHASVVTGDDTLAEARVQSDVAGSADIRFRLPSDTEGAASIVVDVASPLGEDSARHDIRVTSQRKTLLTTDKPIYQPGQRVHMRSLTLRAGDLAAIGGDRITFEVEDAKGNKVFKRPADRNAFGVAFAQFDIADAVNLGTYTVRVVDGEWTQEKAVRVERYVLPKFRVTAEFDRSDYRPGDVVTGVIHADYLFGKPVAGGSVEIVASKFDVGWDRFSRITGRTDQAGAYAFELDLPTYFAGLPLDAGDSFVQFEVTVTDGAEHAETVTTSRPVARVPVQVVLVPETGELVPDVVNELYAVVTTPKGDPLRAAVKVTLGGETREAASDAMGVVTLRFRPSAGDTTATVSVRTASGDKLEREIALDASDTGLLLRPSASLARVGDTIDVVVYSSRERGWVYMDVIRAGQTVRATSAEVARHEARMSFSIEAEDVGTLELHAYQPGLDSDIRRDTRLVHVSPSDDLTIDVKPSADVYRPGEDAEVRFHVSDRSGHPVMAALGIHVVDESVFARQEMQPGLERVFFLLEEELMRPRIEVHGLHSDTVVAPQTTPEAPISAAREQAARVLFAAAEPVARAYSISARTRETRDEAIRHRMREQCAPLAERIAGGVGKYLDAHQSGPWRGLDLVNELTPGGFLQDGDLLDPWGGSAVYADGRVLSAGPDGVLSTDDDVDLNDLLRAATEDWGARGFGLRWGAGRENGVVRLFRARNATVDMEGAGVLLDSMAKAEGLAAVMSGIPAEGRIAGPAAGGVADIAPTRVREFFPETLLAAPSIITDEAGDASLSFPLADSITTWRMTSMASAMDGRLGSVTAGIRVFQDFFIDLDLPVSLTVGDEVSVPVALYNYLDGPQTVRLDIEQADWFELSGPREINADLAEGEVTARYFRIKAVEPGRGLLTVRAFGSEMADAVRRPIEVVPDGRRIETTVSGRVTADETPSVRIPVGALPGSTRLFVKLHPGVFSQIVEGLDAILQMPSGCFEQTSSATYPNILALQYMRETGQNTPEVHMKAQQYIGLGYQRLLSFEVDGGGYEWFGNAPANTVLTAYGLLEFHDMASVHEVDPAVIARTQQFLLRRQTPAGSWLPDPAFLHQESWGRIQDNELLPTAYVLWALAASGLSPDALASAVDFIRGHWQSAEDPYTLAILANALAVAAPKDTVTRGVFERLVGLAVVEGDSAHWRGEIPT
ncbi:hypothetical protein HOK31_18635, partial [Candidatus Poribacteria bacterium]|nr:hypothetical protein [Candidatus Poribacteria bacterium]